MAKRRLDENENLNSSESDIYIRSSEIEEISDDKSIHEEVYEDNEQISTDYVGSNIEYSDIEDMISPIRLSEDVRPSQAQAEEETYDADDIIKAGTIEKDFFDKDFFRLKLASKFSSFYNNFENKKYIKRIKEMCTENLESLEVSYLDIEKESDDLLRLLNQHPQKTIEVMDDALNEVVKHNFPNYSLIKSKVHSRIIDLPVIDTIRSLRNVHLNKLVRVGGVVTRRSGVFPLYSIVKFTCLKCKGVFGPFIVSQYNPTQCFECQSKGPFIVNSSETIYKDFQKLTLQEVPGTVPPGSLPRSKEVLLFYDLIDCAKPGEEVEVIGIYKNNFNVALNIKNGFPVFFTVIEAVSVSKKVGRIEITEDDVKEIKKISRHPDVKNIIINSIAPSIYGHREVKRAIALAMFGGMPKEASSHRIRGDINVLLLGDPGMAKSQFLRYVANTSHRAVLATGQGASSVGLTASVKKDPVLKEWTLEGGALVLADKGVCLIDEFDKMNEHDRTSIHEAMEQQSISISKAGIVATLHARCAVIAAANPTRGRYNPSLTFGQNVNLSDPIISRFDILCVIKDVIDAAEDERMGRFIIGTHQNTKDVKASGLDQDKMILSQDLLRKYIMYARANITPSFNYVDVEKISHLYADLRKESMSSGLPITVRHVESIVRISEAFAKMKLQSSVSPSDIDEAISATLDSFMSAQKYSVTKNMKKKFIKYFNKNDNDVIIFLLKEMFNEKLKAFHSQVVLKDEFERRVNSFGFSIPENFFRSEIFKENGFSYSFESKKIKRAAEE